MADVWLVGNGFEECGRCLIDLLFRNFHQRTEENHEDNIKTNLIDTGLEVWTGFILLSIGNTVMNLRVL
jgi:hypothetical protein